MDDEEIVPGDEDENETEPAPNSDDGSKGRRRRRTRCMQIPHNMRSTSNRALSSTSVLALTEEEQHIRQELLVQQKRSFLKSSSCLLHSPPPNTQYLSTTNVLAPGNKSYIRRSSIDVFPEMFKKKSKRYPERARPTLEEKRLFNVFEKIVWEKDALFLRVILEKHHSVVSDQETRSEMLYSVVDLLLSVVNQMPVVIASNFFVNYLEASIKSGVVDHAKVKQFAKKDKKERSSSSNSLIDMLWWKAGQMVIVQLIQKSGWLYPTFQSLLAKLQQNPNLKRHNLFPLTHTFFLELLNDYSQFKGIVHEFLNRARIRLDVSYPKCGLGIVRRLFTCAICQMLETPQQWGLCETPIEEDLFEKLLICSNILYSSILLNGFSGRSQIENLIIVQNRSLLDSYLQNNFDHKNGLHAKQLASMSVLYAESNKYQSLSKVYYFCLEHFEEIWLDLLTDPQFSCLLSLFSGFALVGFKFCFDVKVNVSPGPSPR